MRIEDIVDSNTTTRKMRKACKRGKEELNSEISRQSKHKNSSPNSKGIHSNHTHTGYNIDTEDTTIDAETALS